MPKPVDEPFAEPLDVRVCENEVVILGPDGISGSFTPDAAVASAKRLLKAAAEAGADLGASLAGFDNDG